MMTWFVEITKISGDDDDVLSILERNGYEITHKRVEEADKRLLSHPRYEEIEDANDIYNDTKHITETLHKFAKLEDITLGIEFGAIQRRNPDGSINRHVFGQLSLTLAPVSLKAEGTVIPNPNVSNEELKRRAEEAILLQAEQKKLAQIALIAAALEIPAILQIKDLLSINDPNGSDLGNIIDLVRDACDGDLSTFATKGDLKSFRGSINNPIILGLKSRHAISSNQPPAKPMSFNQAKAFAHRIGKSWLARFEHHE